MPTTRQEAWRFTDVSALSKIAFTQAETVSLDSSVLPLIDNDAHRLVFVDGHFAPNLSRLRSLPPKGLIASLGQALHTHPELLATHLDRLPGLEDNPFSVRNSALWEDGAFVYLPRRAVLEAPLHLVYFSTGEDTVSYPRSLIVLEDSAQATIVEDHLGHGRYLSCPLSEIRLAQGAVLDYYQAQEQDEQARHLGGLRTYQERDSRLQAFLFSAGGLLARTDVAALLDGEGADCQLNGLTLVAGNQVGDFHVQVDHAKPHGTSGQLFKGVLEGKGRAVFDGLIRVRKDAQKTDASQNNRNLLLSKLALANSNPRLEILADDVKCSHGSSIGFLDQDALFYFRSRGIGLAEAQAMLVYSFANDIVKRIHWVPLRERLEQRLAQRLYPEAAERITV
ncbi:MAG: Fe-S cluster assembly protein SufD [Candidatus Competibacteraceae bacterium]|nr:Fe-S cluster assembly protein SufD [Candidatus Competibacteraceae bacterium]